MSDEDVVTATGLAIAVIATLIERPEPIPRGEVARLLSLLAQTASPDRPGQKLVLQNWAEILRAAQIANER